MRFLCWLGFHKFMHIRCCQTGKRDGRRFCFYCWKEEDLKNE